MNTVFFVEFWKWFLHLKRTDAVQLDAENATLIDTELQRRFAQDLDALIAAEIKKVVEKKNQHIADLCEEITRLDARIYELEKKS